MSYRTIKRVLGETSLERKFRFLFGGGLMLLISGSFYLYATLNRRLIDDPNELKSRYQVASILLRYHWKWAESSDDIRPIIERFADDLKPVDLSDYSWQIIKADPTTASGSTRPFDDVDVAALEAMRGGENKYVYIDKPNKKYVYYAGVRATQSCIDCHYHGQEPGMAVGKLLGVTKVAIPLANTQKAVAINNAILLTTAIVTSFLAMLAAYVIVRVRDRQAGAAPEGRQRRNCARHARSAGRHPHRRRVRRTQPRVQPHACGTWSPCRTSCAK